jgi:hypothetical protein
MPLLPNILLVPLSFSFIICSMKKHRPRPRKPRNRKAPPAREAAATAVVDAEEPHGDGAYYHGGAGWLGVGDYILPRGLTGDQGSRADWPKEYFEAAGVPEDYEDGDYVSSA